MELLAEVQTMNKREARKEQEQKEKQKEIEKEEKQYLKKLTTACRNDLKAEFENEYKQIGTKAKYYFYDIEIREKTIKNILSDYTENTANLYDYLDTNYIKLLNEIDKKYQYNEEAQKAKRQELEKLTVTLHQKQAQMQNNTNQQKQQNKETSKNVREYRKSCVNKSFRDKIKNIKEGFFYGKKSRKRKKRISRRIF